MPNIKSTKEIFFSGRAYKGIRLKELGLVDYLVPGDKLESFTVRMADEIAANAPLALKGTKRVLNLLLQASQFDINSLNEADSITWTSFNENFVTEFNAPAPKLYLMI